MAVTYADIEAQVHNLGSYRVGRAIEIGSSGEPDGIAGTHLLAISSRESGMRNIVGDLGHGRGHLQIDDRYHAAWLKAHEGCFSGAWFSSENHTALDPGHVPLFSDACWKAISILRHARVYGANRGVVANQFVKFMLSAYDAGAGGALQGYRDGDSDLYTTGGDYGADVLARLALVRRVLKDKGLA